MAFRILFCVGILTAGMLLGCATPIEPTTQPVATAVFTATPTITPSPTPTPALVSSPTAAFTPTPSPTPTATPTPDVIPDFLFQEVVEAPFLEAPPLTTNCDDSGEVFESQFPSQVDGPRTYHVYLPPCYGQDGRSYPVLYLFHGSVQTSAHWLELGLARYVNEGIQSGDSPPFIAIMPFNDDEGNMTSGGDFSPEGITINELIPYVDSHYCTWTEAAGRGIGGISRGGYWALMMAFRHEELFSAVSGHSSHLKLETDIALYNPLATYATADLSAMRIWLDRGQNDFLWRGQDQLHSLLTQAGITHEYHLNGGGHNEAYWLIHIQEYLNWHTAVWSQNRATYPPCRV